MVAHVRDAIAARMRDLANPGTLDHLFLTHPDVDHHNLLEDVLCTDAVPKKLRYRIENVWYTGQPRDYRGRAFASSLLGTDPTFRNNLADGTHIVARDPDHVGMLSETHTFRFKPVGTPFPELDLLSASLYADTPGTSKRTASTLSRKRPSTWKNAASVVLLLRGAVTSGNKRQKVLLMGDAEEGVELFLVNMDYTLERLLRENNFWLKAGHHGSEQATTRTLLEHVTPDAIFFSAGPQRFGGTGMPSEAHLANIQGIRAPLRIPRPAINPSQNHPYAFFRPGGAPHFFTANTQEGFGTTMVEVGTGPPQYLGTDWILTLDDPNVGDWRLEFN